MSTSSGPVDWAASIRLALVVSLFAAASALLLADHVAETTIVVSIIVLATMASWFQLEQRPAPRPARVRHH